MQKLPRLTAPVVVVLIAICCLLLRKTARAWQEPEPGSSASPAAPAASSAEPEPPPVPDAEATELVRSARERLSHWESVSARIVERVDLEGRRFKAEGRYVAGEFPRTRIEFEIGVGNTVGRLLEVCDGQVLHILRTIDKASDDSETPADVAAKSASDSAKPSVEAVRRDVQQILRAAANTQNLPLPLHAADLGLGGLPSLLASLERTMVFESLKEEEHNGQRFQSVQGRWKPEFLATLAQQLGGAMQQLGGVMPDKVRIDFEAESQFPMRVMYLKRISPERRSYRPIVTLEFHDVEFDVPLPPETFVYQLPAGVDEGDDTAEFIERLKGSQFPPRAPAAAGSGR